MSTKWITVYTDGSSYGNPGPGGWGAVLTFNNHRKEIHGKLYDVTNNEAELTAILKALETITKKGHNRNIAIYSDSQYAVGVLDRSYKAKANKTLINKINRLVNLHKEVRFSWVPREQNKEADKLSKKANKK